MGKTTNNDYNSSISVQKTRKIQQILMYVDEYQFWYNFV